jgi:hypothetical protein
MKFFEHDGEALYSARVDSLADDDAIVARCGAIEARAWSAREPFVRAMRKSDHLLWSMNGDELRGFALASVSSAAGELVISIDEAMVSPELAGQHVVSRLFWAAACGVTALAAERRARRIVFFALTSSARLISAFYKYRFLLPEHSFDPSAATTALARAYLARRGLEPLAADSSVWVRGAFPAGVREGEPDVPDAPVPPGFDARARGDALLMIGAIPTVVARPIVLARHAAISMSAKGRSVALPWTW